MDTVFIEKIVQGGMGLGRKGGKVVFVPHAVPGETVRVREALSRKDYEIALDFEVREPSPRRITPACPYVPECGGCKFQHMDYTLELEIKLQMFLETWERMGGCKNLAPRIVPSASTGYRNRVRFHCEQNRIGFRAGGRENRLIPVAECLVCVEELNRFLKEYAGGTLRPLSKKELSAFGYRGEYYWEGGRREISVSLEGEDLRFSVDTFFQSNLALLGELIKTHIQPIRAPSILELYGGVGTFGVFLEKHCQKYLMVEEDPTAVRYARKNLTAPHGRVMQGKVEEWIGSAERFEMVIVDPPRAGLSPTVRKGLIRMGSDKILYVSCNPVTLARDAAVFVRGGYQVESVTLYDFYPRTAHTEVVCELKKGH